MEHMGCLQNTNTCTDHTNPLPYAYYKVEAVEEHVGTFLDDPLNGKLLIFAHHKNVIERLCR